MHYNASQTSHFLCQKKIVHNPKTDFLYLPIDFKNQCNVGYGFMNFRTPENTREFMGKFHNVPVIDCLPGFNSRKVVEVKECL